MRLYRSDAGWQQRHPVCGNLIVLSANLFSGTLSRQRLFHSALRARLQVEGVTLHFPDDVFCLNLALESTQGVLDRLTLLQSNFCQTHHPRAKTNQTYLSLLHLGCAPPNRVHPLIQIQIRARFTPSSLRRLLPCRHHRHLLCRRLRLPLLPRLALVGGGHRQLPSDQKALGRGILDVFCSCPDSTPCAARQRQSAIVSSTAIITAGAVTFFSSFRSSDLSQSI